jgi:hypothetical protein
VIGSNWTYLIIDSCYASIPAPGSIYLSPDSHVRVYSSLDFDYSKALTSGTLFTVSEGQLGICWGDVNEDDVVTLLEGASAPIVLRKTGESYIYVAPAYVAGIMNG